MVRIELLWIISHWGEINKLGSFIHVLRHYCFIQACGAFLKTGNYSFSFYVSFY